MKDFSDHSDQCQHSTKEVVHSTLALGSPPVTNRIPDIVYSVLRALDAPDPNPRSPAFAVQLAAHATCGDGESRLEWIPRFLSMSGREYMVGWDIYEHQWTANKDTSVCGMTIAEDCVYWMQRNWDFTSHENDDRFDYDADPNVEPISA